MAVPKMIEIADLKETDRLTVVRDPESCSVSENGEVHWKSDQLKDFVVIFGPNAPVHPKVAKPGSDGVAKMKLKGERPEDFRHCKYVIVGLTQAGVLKAEDPELIVDG